MDGSDYLWWRDGIIYQIYPRSFSDSNQDGLGDLRGILAHLDYLSSLGIDAIWLSPVYPSPDVDFGYDVSDYNAIDPRFGTLEDFDLLVSESHQRGIHIILDLVLNHTSDQHPWFKASRSSREDPYHDWYLWRDPRPGGGFPNNWESVVGGRAWEYEPGIGQYYLHSYFRQQPDLNWRNPQVRQAMLDIFRYWLDRGVDGFRLDVFNIYFKHPNLPNNPSKIGLRGFDRQRHLYDRDQPEMLPVLAEIRHLLDSYPERYAVGEPEFSDAYQSAYYCGKDRLPQAFNFELLKAGQSPRRCLNAIQRWEAALQPDSWPCYCLNNHDQTRTASRFCRGEEDARLKIMAAFLLTLRGTPFIYYGEEIGMRNISLGHNQILDPVGKRFWPLYKGRDGCRSPMQWDASHSAGFTNAEPWIPVHPDYPTRNVLLQNADSKSLLNFYRSLITIRRQVMALQQGELIPLTLKPVHILAYLRKISGQMVLVALNFSNHPQTLDLSAEIAHRKWECLLSTSPKTVEPTIIGRLILDPLEVLLLLNQE
jgi:alpha-glucosidase